LGPSNRNLFSSILTEPSLTLDKPMAKAPGPAMHGAILQLATSRGVAIAISLVTAPILGRLYPPEAYGALNVLTTMVSVLAAVTTLSYVSAIPLASSPSERRDLFVLCSMIGLVMTLVVAVGAFFGADELASTFHEPQIAKYAMFLPVLFLENGVRQVLDTTLTCQRRFIAVAVRNVLEIAVARIVQFGACLVGLLGSPLGLILGILSASAVSATTAGLTSIRDVLGMADKPFCMAGLRAAALKHRKFPLITCWSATLNALTFGLPAIVLGMRFSVATVGLYGMAYTMVALPLQLFASSATQVFYVEAGERVALGQSAAPAARQMIRLLTVLTSFPLTVILILGPLIFEVFLGPKWHEAGVYAQILVPWMAWMTFSAPLCVVFATFNRQGEGFYWNIALLMARFSSLYFGGLFFSIRETLGMFVAASVIIVVLLIFRSLSLLGVGRRWATGVIVFSYVPPMLLLAPAGVLYWLFDAKIGALAALAIACAGYVLVLHFRHPHIVKALMARLVSSRT
jgi:lipopolysaccharide exporter